VVSRGITRGGCLRAWFRALAFAAMLLPAAAYAEEVVPAPLSYQVNGSFSTKYISRSTDDPAAQYADRDVFADLRLDVKRPTSGSPEFHFLGASRSDLDGNQTVAFYSPFEDINNTHDRRTTSTVYEAYVLLSDQVRPDTSMRIGRQAGNRDEQVFFDGIAADMDLAGEKVNLSLYLGTAAHFSEVNGHYGTDRVQGAGIDLKPLPGTGMSADIMVVDDEQELPADNGTVHDSLVSFKAWQRISSMGNVSAKYRLQNSEPRDITLKAFAASSEEGGEALVSYFRQFRTQEVRSNELSPFYDVLGQSAPYQSYDIRLRKHFTEWISADLGYFKRALLDAPADQGPFDREYSRKYLGVEVSDLGLAGLSWTLTAEEWESGTRKFHTTSTDLSYVLKKINKREARISVGSAYSLYRYDYYLTLGAREQVRAYYCSAQYPFVPELSANATFEHEHGIENYDTLRLGMRYDF